MCKLGACNVHFVVIGEDNECWLVPERVADAQPPLGDEWRGANCTRMRYRYAALTEGLLPRFITRTYPLSEETKVRWVNGFVF